MVASSNGYFTECCGCCFFSSRFDNSVPCRPHWLLRLEVSVEFSQRWYSVKRISPSKQPISFSHFHLDLTDRFPFSDISRVSGLPSPANSWWSSFSVSTHTCSITATSSQGQGRGSTRVERVSIIHSNGLSRMHTCYGWMCNHFYVVCSNILRVCYETSIGM